MILVEPGHAARLSVPLKREVAPGTLGALIRASGMSVQRFQDFSGHALVGGVVPWGHMAGNGMPEVARLMMRWTRLAMGCDNQSQVPSSFQGSGDL